MFEGIVDFAGCHKEVGGTVSTGRVAAGITIALSTPGREGIPVLPELVGIP